MGRLFGTDGVRGVAGRDLTARFVTDLAAAAAVVLPGLDVPAGRAAATGRRRPVALVGRDPRASGQFLEAAVVAGLAGAGVDVRRLDVLPTPAVAYLTGALAADFGVMLSASHNPAPDNGIKFFARGGLKLPDAVEDEIERRLASGVAPGQAGGARPEMVRLKPCPRLDSGRSPMRQTRSSAISRTCWPRSPEQPAMRR